MHENLNLMRQAGREGVAEAMALTTRVAYRITSLNQKVKTLMIIAAAGLVLSFNSALAFAAGACGNEAASKLSGFINQAATFLIVIGGAAALLMFAVGALMIIFAHNSSRKSKGMDILKNSVIGLIVLGAGAFFRFVVVKFIDGLTTGKNQTNCIPTDNGAAGGG